MLIQELDQWHGLCDFFKLKAAPISDTTVLPYPMLIEHMKHASGMHKIADRKGINLFHFYV